MNPKQITRLVRAIRRLHDEGSTYKEKRRCRGPPAPVRAGQHQPPGAPALGQEGELSRNRRGAVVRD